MDFIIGIFGKIIGAFMLLGIIGLIIWMCRGIWSMIKGDGPGSLPWL